MAVAEALQKVASLPPRIIDAKELEYIAYCGAQETTHGIFRSIPGNERSLYSNKYILNEVITGGITKLKKFLASSAEGPAADEKEFIEDTVQLFIASSAARGTYPRELFQSILSWSEELTRLSLLREALHYYDKTLSLGINKFPDLYIQSLMGKAALLNTLGSFRDAQSILRSLSTRPYIIPNRNLIPEILFDLGRESLLKGDILSYKHLLFRGLRHFYTRVENRRQFVEQITKTYRRSFRVLLDRHISTCDKVLFTMHRLYFAMEGVRLLNVLRVTSVMRLFVLGCVYGINYGLRTPPMDSPVTMQQERGPGGRSVLKKRNMLVTRAMGGVGDLLMMTPGLHALKKKQTHHEIHLAIPKRYFPVFEGNTDVKLLDIENDEFNYLQYRRWFNFTDCPASRVESRTAPNVKKSRIEIFARALGINPLAVRLIDMKPRYVVLPEERAFQINFWKSHGLDGKKVVGIQLRSEEVYRDYPHMEELVDRVARDYHVLLFDAETIHGFNNDRIVKVDGLPLRKAFALASASNAIIAPDSSFVHFAAAFDIPCVALFGPIDGNVRTKHYPNCTYLDVKKKLGCSPCWRNGEVPCKLTNMRASVCMTDISIIEISEALTEVLRGTP